MAKSSNPKADLRFNDTRTAVMEIAKAVKSSLLKDEAIAILVTGMGSGISKTQVMLVLKRLKELEKHYCERRRWNFK